jgi:predicted TIM-barrel fold metal-dependent hydrolase
MTVDAHAHVFPQVRGLVAAGSTRGLGYGRVAFGDHSIQLLPPFNEATIYTPEMLLAHMDWAGVDKAVLLQGIAYGDCNQYVLEALSRYPDRLVGAAYLDPWDPGYRRMLEMICASSAFRAVKLECSEATGLCGIHPEARLDAPSLAWLWDELERRELVLVVDLGAVGSRSYQTRAMRAIAEEHPDLKIVIAHLGQPSPAVEADPKRWNLWLEQIDLGRLPNLWFDNASLLTYLPSEDYPYPSAERYMRLAIERIGPAKIMWGSDQPGLLSHATYPQLVRLARLHTRFLSPGEQAMVLGGNASQVYGC